jgi:hypothetical protein
MRTAAYKIIGPCRAFNVKLATIHSGFQSHVPAAHSAQTDSRAKARGASLDYRRDTLTRFVVNNAEVSRIYIPRVRNSKVTLTKPTAKARPRVEPRGVELREMHARREKCQADRGDAMIFYHHEES